MTVMAMILSTAAFAQEQHPYSEYTSWFSGAFGSGHAFSET
jgi:hypothetical protein